MALEEGIRFVVFNRIAACFNGRGISGDGLCGDSCERENEDENFHTVCNHEQFCWRLKDLDMRVSGKYICSISLWYK